MSITLPDLDDRRWSDLVEQGRALIPLYAPEWTDHNASDPGITLMELFAWVAEMDIYRLNRLTRAQKLRLLALMDVRPEPPHPATVVGSLRIGSGAPSVALPAGSQLAGTLHDGTPVLLRTVEPFEVVNSALRAIQCKHTALFHNVSAAWLRHEPIALFGDDPVPGAEFYLGFDQALPGDAWTQLFVGIDGAHASLAERARVTGAHHGARIVWEYLAGPNLWRALETVDATRAFSLAGCVRLRPAQAMASAALGRVDQVLYWVRCRFEQGAFDSAPRAEHLIVNGAELIQAVPVTTAWPIAAGTVAGAALTPGQSAALRITLRQGQVVGLSIDSAPDAPTLLVLAYQAASASAAGLLMIEGALAGVGSGEPGQRFVLNPRPVVESSLRLFSIEGGSGRVWKQVGDLAGSRRTDAHFHLDPSGGEVTVGDGENGRVVPAGCQLFACYETTAPAPALAQLGGLADTPHNRAFLSADSIAAVGAGLALVMQAATPAETLTHAIGRAIASREARLRAVTTEDFEAIALETPGLRVARAIARPNLYPGLDCVRAPGMMTVIVLPMLPLGRPMPSAGFLARIAERIEQRRTIGTRVVVAGPRYLEVAVRATVKALAGSDKQRVATQVAQALDGFFHPLSGGLDGTGWPLGRDIYRAEVMQVIDQTPGVDHVLALDLVAEHCAPSCANVCLRPTWLVAAGLHNITVS